KGLGWLGLRAEIVNINYNDISTIKLKCGIFTTELYFKFRSSDYTLKLPALEKGAAQRASQLVQRGIRGELPGQGQMVMVPEKQVNGDEPATATTAAASEHLEKRESNLMITPLPLSPPCAINTTSCRYCNYSLQQAANFCPECGKSVKIETNILKVCPNCDSVTSYNAVFCSTCHQKFPDNLVQ
ncbi:MAG TPA: zinc ribbon domain-containing protein, partial [Nitrososphaera sp.]|nr:zinc ribbon domain-containing protein [Nitrososphaera sp.]